MKNTIDTYKNSNSNDVFEFICANCGKRFFKSKKEISKNRYKVPKFCSTECAKKAHAKKTKQVVCAECGKKYEISEYEYNKKMKEGTLFFCSRSCSAKCNNRKFPKRAKLPKKEKEVKVPATRDFELGHYIGYDGKKTYLTHKCSQIRRDARRFMEKFSKQEKVCCYCHNHEFDDILEVHHLKGILEFDPHTKIKDINNDDNLVWLCPNHHTMLEKGMIHITGYSNSGVHNNESGVSETLKPC